MALKPEEKKQRAEQRKKEKAEKEHKVINNITYKWCCEKNHWVIMDKEHFYTNDKNSIDGFSNRCKECDKKRSRKHKKDNREYYAIVDHNYKIENREYVRKYNREYKEKFPNKKKEALIRFYENNPEKYKEYMQNHRQHDITTPEWNNTLNVFEHKCCYCDISEEEAKEKFGEQLHKDHIIHDGYNDIRNAAPACKDCNSKKWQTDFKKWFREQPFFTEEKLNKIIWWMNEGYKKYIEDKPPYRITRCRIYREDGSYYMQHQIWLVDEKRNLLEIIEIGRKKQDVIKLWNDKYRNIAI